MKEDVEKDVFIKEKDYQIIKRILNKEGDYFTIKEFINLQIFTKN